MDEATLSRYQAHADEYARRYESIAAPHVSRFASAFAAGGRILDVGFGSGRDLAALLQTGFDAYGIEPVEALRALALKAHPELAGRIDAGMLPRVGRPFGGEFDGLLCSAVLMHLRDEVLFDAAFALRSLLRLHGRLMLSVPTRPRAVGADLQDAEGRLFVPHRPDYLVLLFERLGFRLIDRWESPDALGRSEPWTTLLLELDSVGASRAVDQIEGILNRDRKVATYKLALFRALAGGHPARRATERGNERRHRRPFRDGAGSLDSWKLCGARGGGGARGRTGMCRSAHVRAGSPPEPVPGADSTCVRDPASRRLRPFRPGWSQIAATFIDLRAGPWP